MGDEYGGLETRSVFRLFTFQYTRHSSMPMSRQRKLEVSILPVIQEMSNTLLLVKTSRITTVFPFFS